MSVTVTDLLDLANACDEVALPRPLQAPRLFSIWEITTWILPMAPEHFRRVLAGEPDLPQGSSGTEGGTRWFTSDEVTALRTYFAPRSRKGRYRPTRPEGSLAPLIALTGPQGHSGRSTALLHLATAAALAGWRVLVIDADPSGRLSSQFRGETAGAGVLSLIARAAGLHLRRANTARLDLGEPPLPMEDSLSAALGLRAQDLIRPTAWPGLDLMAATEGLLMADVQIAAWRMAQRAWQPWRALAEALTNDGLRQHYDLIFCDTGRGLGPLALSVLASADVLLAPLPLQPNGAEGLARGLRGFGQTIERLQADAQVLAQALGQTGPGFGWQKLAILPTRAGPDAPLRLAGFAAKLGANLLPAALPEIAQIADARAAQFYDIDYRSLGRLSYAPHRDALEAGFKGVTALLADLWAEQITGQPVLL